ncbi:hypothetical protein HPB47_015053 [Ixodes persulcatus]|uniref:Uncharacterized protein n=1 Tax=Ixodes persulcatus TaxID=34615 RepID=A0AC60QUF4_IXOPE|nr:hypothetical protein HPB47_015053 [Ixodes persulcatus]
MVGMDSAAGGKRLVGQPVTVIRVDEKGKLTVDSKALRSVLLQKDVQNLPVVVLLVAGAFRTGKSSILNVLLRFPYLQCRDWLGEPDKPLEGFSWKSGSDAHTEGIVFWSHLFRATTADKKEVAVLLVDTQGSFGTGSSTAESVHICALSVLISSIQVFNVMRNLQLDHLQHLQMYYEYGKRAQELEGGTSGFQLCVFLVRDWEWPKDCEFGWKGGEQLLQKILGEEPKKKVTNELRALRNYFELCLSSRKCFLMPSPGHTDDGCSLNGAVYGKDRPEW